MSQHPYFLEVNASHRRGEFMREAARFRVGQEAQAVQGERPSRPWESGRVASAAMAVGRLIPNARSLVRSRVLTLLARGAA